jgi:hypothetical protein
LTDGSTEADSIPAALAIAGDAQAGLRSRTQRRYKLRIQIVALAQLLSGDFPDDAESGL